MLLKLIKAYMDRVWRREVEYWWHSPSADFKKFDIERIGSRSLKYGWGIYFAGTLKHAINHNMKQDHIYRIPVSKVNHLPYLIYTKDLKEHANPQVHVVARQFYGAKYDDKSFHKIGHRFYKDIYESERLRVKDSNGCAARYLSSNGIVGGVVDESGERIIVIYDTQLWDHAERVNLNRDEVGKVSVLPTVKDN